MRKASAPAIANAILRLSVVRLMVLNTSLTTISYLSSQILPKSASGEEWRTNNGML